MQEYLDFAIEIAKYAGVVIKDNFLNDSNSIEYKIDRTPVTIADKKINSYLIEKVKEKYKEHSVDGEEEKYLSNSKYVWVCDPIDGTSMYTRGIMVSVFSLALVFDGVPIVGVVYDPYLDKMYTAIKGNGAYCNDKKIHVNSKKYGEIGLSIDWCMWNNAKYDTIKLAEILREKSKMCQLGSTAHAAMLVAEGKISAEIFPGTDHGHCDIAASKLIVEEAGGKVTDFFGNDQRYDQEINGAILTNGIIHDDIIKVNKKIYKKSVN